MSRLRSLIILVIAANVCMFNAYGMKRNIDNHSARKLFCIKKLITFAYNQTINTCCSPGLKRKQDAQEKVQENKKQQIDTRELNLINKKIMPEILTMIFGYLPQQDLRLMTRKVCRAWNDLILKSIPFSLQISNIGQRNANDLIKFLQKLQTPISLNMSFLIDLRKLNNLKYLTIQCPIQFHPKTSIKTLFKTLWETCFKKSGRTQDPLTQLPETLEGLALNTCNITDMPNLTSLLNLKELDLTGNMSLNINTLVSKLPKSLVKLTLIYCRITEMPDLTSLLNLKELNLSDNRSLNINTLASKLPTSLAKLTLKYYDFTEDQRQALKQALPNVIIIF